MNKAFYFLFGIFICQLVSAQSNSAYDSLMQYCIDNFRFSGVVLVAEGNKILYEKAKGRANEGKNIDITSATKFRLGSISKQFTSFLTLQLLAEGKLSLADPIGKYIKAFDQPEKSDITIRNLLTHSSGLTDYTNLRYFDDKVFYSKDSIINMIWKAPVLFRPGSQYSYSNSNFFLLACIIENITGKKFKDVLQEKILTPAGMRNSGEEEDSPIMNEAIGYEYRKGKPVVASYINMKNTQGGGGMFSTAEDMFRWSRFFQEKISQNSILTNSIQPLLLTDGSSTIYSCGWCLFPDYIFHQGHINGFANTILIDTVRNITIVILSNHDYRNLFITMNSLWNLVQRNPAGINWLHPTSAGNFSDYKGNYKIRRVNVTINDSSNCLLATAYGQTNKFWRFQNDDFYSPNFEAILRFIRDEHGKVVAVKSLEDYEWVPGTKESSQKR